MGQGKLTSEEIALLCENPYVKAISNNRIRYTKEFKVHFMKEYLEGKKGPTQIFREAGFDTKMLGPKRIERAAAHWKEAYETSTLVDCPNREIKKQSRVAQLEALKEENRLLKEQIQLLSRLQNLQGKSSSSLPYKKQT